MNTYKKSGKDPSGADSKQDGDSTFDLSFVPEEHREWAANRIQEGATLEEIAVGFIKQSFDSEKRISKQGTELGDLRGEIQDITAKMAGGDTEISGQLKPDPNLEPPKKTEGEISPEVIQEYKDLFTAAEDFKKIKPEVQKLTQVVSGLKADVVKEAEQKAVAKFLSSAKELETLLGPELMSKYLNKKDIKNSPIYKYLDPDAIFNGVKNPHAQSFWAEDSPCIAVWRKIAPDDEIADVLAKRGSETERGIKSGMPKAGEASGFGKDIKTFLEKHAQISKKTDTYKPGK